MGAIIHLSKAPKRAPKYAQNGPSRGPRAAHSNLLTGRLPKAGYFFSRKLFETKCLFLSAV